MTYLLMARLWQLVASLPEFSAHGARTLALVDDVQSPLAAVAHVGIDLPAGPEHAAQSF